jgi:hypothetical protein
MAHMTACSHPVSDTGLGYSCLVIITWYLGGTFHFMGPVVKLLHPWVDLAIFEKPAIRSSMVQLSEVGY